MKSKGPLTDDFESGYRSGFLAGVQFMTVRSQLGKPLNVPPFEYEEGFVMGMEDLTPGMGIRKKKKRSKISAYNKFVKDNAGKPRFRYKTGPRKGKVNFKKLGVAWRKTAAYKKSKRK